MGDAGSKIGWKKGCLWAGGIVFGGFILLWILASLLPDLTPEELAELEASDAGGSDEAQSVIAALEEARDALTGANSEAWPDLGQAAYDASRSAFDVGTASPDDDAWSQSWIAIAASNLAHSAGRSAHLAGEEFSQQFSASMGRNTREVCNAANISQDLAARASLAYDIAIAAWKNEAVEMSDTASLAANQAERNDEHDCSELEPTKLGPGGSSLEPEMTYDFAAENATYFTGRCGPRISQFTPLVEQRRCFSTGEKSYRFFSSWVPQADREWIDASEDRKSRLEQAAETYMRNVTETLETLNWLPNRDGLPIFTPHRLN